MEIKLDIGDEAKKVFKHVLEVWPRCASLIRSYARGERRQFELLSSVPAPTSYKTAALLALAATTLALGWSLLTGRALGAPLWWSVWLLLKQGVILLILIGLSLYIGMRIFGGKRLGSFITNLLAVSQIILYPLFGTIMLIGLSASGSLYDDIVKTRQGDKTTPYYHLVCEGRDLTNSLERDYDRLTVVMNQLSKSYRELTGREMSGPDVDKNLTPEGRMILEPLAAQVRQMENDMSERIAARDRLPAWKDVRVLWGEYLPFSLAIVLSIAITVWITLRNFRFLMSALHQPGRRPRPGKAFGRVAFASVFAVTVSFLYVQAAQGVPVWLTDDDQRNENQFKAYKHQMEQFCAPSVTVAASKT